MPADRPTSERTGSFAATLRGAMVLAGFAALTLPLMPVQAALLRFSPNRARTFPHWYHTRVCRLLGIRVHVEGSARSRPAGAARRQPYIMARYSGDLGRGAALLHRQDRGWNLALRFGAGQAAAHRVRRPQTAPKRRRYGQ